jgi:cysteine-rich repeat protein
LLARSLTARLTLGVLAPLLLAACQQARSQECNGLLCPPGLVCAPHGRRCVLAQQVSACNNAKDGTKCTLSGLSSGKCVAGLCEGATCANGVRDPGEKCDDGNRVDGDGCSHDCLSDETCGNGVLDPAVGEQCDDGNTLNADACQATCRLPRCGDGVKDPDEICDDANRVSGDGCSADCHSDESCGNGVLDQHAGEGCDCGTDPSHLPVGCTEINSDAPTAGCRSGCLLPGCGDGLLSAAEDCEGKNLRDASCADVGFYSGTLSCARTCRYDTSDCVGRCGDGVRNGDEACDGQDLGSADCLSLGYHNPQGLGCTAACTFDTSACTGFCGDAKQDATEQCDGSDLAGSTCSDLGFYDARGLTCTKLCAFDTSMCKGFCGDQIKNGSEQCDGSDVGALDCTAFGYYQAPGLACNRICAIDVSACQGYCGDKIVNGPEACDGAPPTDGCLDYGFDYGLLDCSGVCQRSLASCSYLGWKREQTDTSSAFGDVWSSGPSNVFVTGGPTGVMHFDGSGWTPMTLPQPSFVPSAIWGSGPADVFCAGLGGTILHYDGVSWSVMSSGTATEQFEAIGGSGPRDVFAVASSGAIYHYDGSAWSAMVSGTTSELTSVWASGPRDVYAVGANKTVLHFNGTTWSTPTGPWASASGTFTGVWGRGPSDVYITGSYAFHYDGATWTQITTGARSFTTGISGNSTDAFIVGDAGSILHYDGRSWSRMTSHVTATLWSVWANPDGSAFAVGNAGTVLRLTGMDLTPSGANSVGTSQISKVWAAAPDDAFGVGAGGAIYHFDGASWTAMTSGTTQTLRDVWGNGSKDVFAVGYNGTVLHYDGTSWSPIASGSTGTFTSVWSTGPRDVFVGDNGNTTTLHYDGTSWSSISHFIGPVAMWGDAPNDVFAVAGLVLEHYDGSIWKLLGAASHQLSAIWGSGPSDVFASDFSGGIYHWDGSTFSTMNSGTTVGLQSLWGTGPRDVFAGGANGLLLHFDGTRWSPIRTPTSEIYAAGFSHGKTTLMVSLDSGRSDRLWRDTGTTCDSCASGGACNPRVELPCNTTVASSTLGYKNVQQSYACSAATDAGPERYYRIVASNSGAITAKLSHLTADLDLVALATDTSEACITTTGGCLAASANAGLLDEQLTFPATAGAVYYLAIDGKSTSGSYFLDVSCQ